MQHQLLWLKNSNRKSVVISCICNSGYFCRRAPAANLLKDGWMDALKPSRLDKVPNMYQNVPFLLNLSIAFYFAINVRAYQCEHSLRSALNDYLLFVDEKFAAHGSPGALGPHLPLQPLGRAARSGTAAPPPSAPPRRGGADPIRLERGRSGRTRRSRSVADRRAPRGPRRPAQRMRRAVGNCCSAPHQLAVRGSFPARRRRPGWGGRRPGGPARGRCRCRWCWPWRARRAGERRRAAEGYGFGAARQPP